MKTDEEQIIQTFMKDHGIKSMKTHDGIDFCGKLPEEVLPKKKTLDEQIADLQQKLLEVKGTECEKYARIVGYYRAVKNWNIGKKSEWEDRINYDPKSFNNKEPKDTVLLGKESIEEDKVSLLTFDSFDHYRLFYRPTCPSCPAVKTLMANTTLLGNVINAEDNMDIAMQYNVCAVPTVVFFDESDIEITRASQIADVKKALLSLQEKGDIS